MSKDMINVSFPIEWKEMIDQWLSGKGCELIALPEQAKYEGEDCDAYFIGIKESYR